MIVMRTVPETRRGSRRLRAALVVAALAGTLAACGSSGGASSTGNENGNGSGRSDQGKVDVVTTTTQLTDFARIVGGDRVDVYGLMKANVDPHDYEPSPADIEQIADADVVVQNGVGLEKWFAPTIKSAHPRGLQIDASKGMAIRNDDPHIWHNPQNARAMVGNIAAALAQADPGHAAEYTQRRDTYDAELDRLDAEISSQIAGLANKKLVT